MLSQTTVLALITPSFGYQFITPLLPTQISEEPSNIAISVVNAIATGTSSGANTTSSPPAGAAPPSIDGSHAGEILAASWGIAGIAAAGDGPLPFGDAVGLVIGVGGTLWALGVVIDDNYEAISDGIGAGWNWFTDLFNSGSSALTVEETAILDGIVTRTMTEFNGEIVLSNGKADPKEFSKGIDPPIKCHGFIGTTMHYHSFTRTQYLIGTAI